MPYCFYDEELKMSPSDLIEALYRINGKAEIVNGEMVMDAPAGGRHGRAAAMIFTSLLAFEKAPFEKALWRWPRPS